MRKGFTLIELLISISLSIILLFTGFYVLSSHTKLFSKSYKNINQQQIASLVLDRISEDIISASKILSGSTVSNLILEYPTYNISYDYKNRKVRRRKGKSSAYLTDKDDLDSLSFSYSGKLVTIKVDDYETKAYCRN